jgi:2,3-dihydroxy-p-cumate/2,3-dihydroxybenzoate 3,4-dioxygenase
VTDIERSIKHYVDLVGLELVERVENGPAFLRCSSDHHSLILYPSNEAGVKKVGFEVESPEQLDIAFEHFTMHGLNPEEVDAEELKLLRQGRTIRFKDPVVGLTFELFNDIEQLGKEYKPTVTKIARLGHLVINAKEVNKMVNFMKDVMNFRISDFVEEHFVFMRCFPNKFHHSFAISHARGDEDTLHHVNFMVTDIDDIGKAGNRLTNNDVPVVFGPGRHAPSTSIFLYFLDPDGMTSEYSFGMEEFPENGPRKPRRLEKSLAILDVWGGEPDPRTGSFGKIDQS